MKSEAPDCLKIAGDFQVGRRSAQEIVCAFGGPGERPATGFMGPWIRWK